MRSFPVTARIRIVDELAVKEGIQRAIDCVVEDAVADTRLVNIPWFGIRDGKGIITAVFIRSHLKIVMQIVQIIKQVPRKVGNVLFITFPRQKFLPSRQKIIKRN